MLIFCVAAFAPDAALAACANPARTKSALAFNSATGELMYCNDTDWVSMGPPPKLRGPGLPQDGLVGWWKFDDGSGGTAADSSGSGNHGTLTNGPVWSTGIAGGAMTFDGSDDYVEVGDTASLDITGDFTVSGWVKISAFDNDDGWPRIINKENTNTGYGVFLSDAASGVEVFGIQVQAQTLLGVAQPLAGRWYHVTGVHDTGGGQLRIYVNGILDSSATLTATLGANSEPFRIGGSLNSTQVFKGQLDDIRVYNRALSAEEIAQCCAASASLSVGLVGHWTLDDGAGGTAVDSSGNGNDGTLTNMDAGTDWVEGKLGTALDFDGVDDFVNAGDPANGVLDFGTSSFSLSAWVKTGLINGSRIIWKGGHGTSTAGYEMFLGSVSGNLSCALSNGAGSRATYFSTNGGITDNVWHHVSCVFDRVGGTRLYVDGVEETFGTSGLNVDSTLGLYIGSRSGPDAVNGLIDDVRIYNRALSAAEVKMLYNIRNPGTLRYNASYRVPEYFNGEYWTPVGKVQTPTTDRKAPTGWSTSNFLDHDGAVGGHTDVAYSAWFFRNTTSGHRTAMVIGRLNQADHRTQFTIYANANEISMLTRSTVTAGPALSTTAFPAGEWALAWGALPAVDFREAGFNGGNLGTNTASATPDTPNRFRIGNRPNDVEPFGSTDAIAEAAVWDIAGFSAQDRADLHTKLANGENPVAINAEVGEPWEGRLIAYPDMDINSPTFGQDLSGNGNHFDMVGTLAAFDSYPPVDGPPAEGCTDPERPEGKIVYNDTANAMQYCDGVTWRRIGK